MKTRWILNLGLLAFAAMAAFGQEGTSNLVGTVHDPHNATIPSAAVKLTSTLTGATRNVVTNQSGEFRFEAVPSGEYNLEVTSQGFKTLNIARIALASSETRDVGTLAMQLGAVSEAVSVMAEVTPVQT